MNVPAWCNTDHLRGLWKHPWKVSPDGRKNRRFKKLCWDHGYLSPHFKRSECASKDGVPIPDSLRGPAQKQAFRMEKYRHAIGDRPITFLSWYRSPDHNAAVRGASESQHLRACATDRRYESTSNVLKIWHSGGIGWQGPGIGNGAIFHTDSRRTSGGVVQWSYS